MQNRLLVGGSLRRGWYLWMAGLTASLVLAAIVLQVALANNANGQVGGIGRATWNVIVATVLIVAAVALAAATLWIRLQRRWLEVDETGFTILDRGGQRRYDDAAVTTLGVGAREHFSQGVLSGVSRIVRLNVRGIAGDELLELTVRVKVGRLDPLAPWIARLDEMLYRRAKAAREAGETVEGEDWTLLVDEVLIETFAGPKLLKLSEIGAIGVVADRLSFWRRGEEEPAAALPIERGNANVLARLANDEIEAGEPDVFPHGSLGRLMFVRGPSDSEQAIRIGSIFATLIAVFACAVLVSQGMIRPALWTGAGAAASVLVYFTVLKLSAEYRFYDAGVCRHPLRGGKEKRLALAEADSIAYRVIRMYHNGAYTGTVVSLTLRGTHDGRNVNWRYSRTIRHADNDLTAFYSMASAQIAERLRQQVERGETIQWTKRVHLSREGMRIASRRLLFLATEPQFIPWDGIDDCLLNNGHLKIMAIGQRRPLATVGGHVPNFQAGVFLIQDLMASAQDALDASPTPTAIR